MWVILAVIRSGRSSGDAPLIIIIIIIEIKQVDLFVRSQTKCLRVSQVKGQQLGERAA